MTHSRTANHSETKQTWQIRLNHQTTEWCAKNHRTGTFKRLQTPSLLVDVERFETWNGLKQIIQLRIFLTAWGILLGRNLRGIGFPFNLLSIHLIYLTFKSGSSNRNQTARVKRKNLLVELPVSTPLLNFSSKKFFTFWVARWPFLCFFKAQPWSGSFLDKVTVPLPSCVSPAFPAQCDSWTPVTFSAHFFRAKSRILSRSITMICRPVSIWTCKSLWVGKKATHPSSSHIKRSSHITGPFVFDIKLGWTLALLVVKGIITRRHVGPCRHWVRFSYKNSWPSRTP